MITQNETQTAQNQNTNSKFNLTVKIKTIYGRETVYPVCNKSHIFANIAGTLTLTPETITRIELLGFVLEVETPTL